MNNGYNNRKISNVNASSIVAIIGIILAVVLVVGGGVYAYMMFGQPTEGTVAEAEAIQPEPMPEPAPEPEPEQEPEAEILMYPVGRIGPEEGRIGYVSGEMHLRIPKMSVDTPVHSSDEDLDPESETYRGVNDGVLKQGPGLFGASQLPGEGNSNVSIAAHRDIDGKEFWDIDKMEEGDYIYITYQGKEYTYIFEELFITHDSDWDPILVKDYSRVTLQSCHPIWVASERIFVVGRLESVRDIEEALNEAA